MLLEFYKKPKCGEVYNIGGGRYSNCSVIEAINYIKEKKDLNIKLKYEKIELVIIYGI